MHWKKNRIVNPEAKEQIVQTGECPGCGRTVKFYYGEHGQFCAECKKVAAVERAGWVAERMAKKTRRSRQLNEH
jgi:endogenous inhibitor of DNA gyrase (YacG/DUF329 family)